MAKGEPMAVELRKLTHDNFEQCINLTVTDEQAGFVKSNLFSLAQAHVDSEVTPLAIYADGTMVGFLMYGVDDEDGRYWLLRLMIDKYHQGKGYATDALQMLIERLRTQFSCPALYLSFSDDNERAKQLFPRLGWERTEEWTNNEAVYVLDLSSRG